MKAGNILLWVMINWVFESCEVSFTASSNKPAYVDLFAVFFFYIYIYSLALNCAFYA